MSSILRIVKQADAVVRVVSTGEQGTPGLRWQGDYASDVTYRPGDAVFYAGTSYIALIDAVGTEPGSSPETWSPLVTAGGIASLDDIPNVNAPSPSDITVLGYRTSDSLWKPIDLNSAINVKLYGAVGDGVTDDTTAIQNAINAATNGTGPNRHAGVYFPSGIYICSSTLTIPLSNGFCMYGAGAAVDATTAGHTNILRGSVLKFSGGVGLTLDGCYSFHIARLTIQNANVGVRLQNRVGHGSGVGVFEQISTLHNVSSGIGFQVGFNPGAGYDNNNAGDLTFIRCLTKSISGTMATAFFQSLQDQNLNFEFIGCVGNRVTDCFDLVKGGNIIAIDFTTYDCENLLKVTNGGVNVGSCMFDLLRIDGSAFYTTLFKAVQTSTMHVRMNGVTINVGQLLTSNYTSQAARFQLKQGNRVEVESCLGFNWNAANGGASSVTGPIVSFDATSTGGAIFELKNAVVTSDTATIVGTNTSNRGIARAVRCHNAVSGGYLAEWSSDNSHYVPWSILSSVPSTFAPSAHTHDAADINAGTLGIARIPTGSSSSTVCIGNDARLSDARTPTTHTQAWSTITSTPTTLVGYGITNAYTQAEVDAIAGNKADSDITISAGSGLVGGGDLTVSRSLSANFGTAAGTICQGNDSRLSDARTPTSHTLVSHTASGLTSGQVLVATGATSFAFTTPTFRTYTETCAETPNGSTTAFTFGASAGTIRTGSVLVRLNGVVQRPGGSEVTINEGAKTATFVTAPATGDWVAVDYSQTAAGSLS